MAEKISIQIALEGGAAVEKQLEGIGEAGQRAFTEIEKSAEQVGGFKNLKPEEVTTKLKAMGLEGTEAFGKIQKAVATAVKFEQLVVGIQSVETAFVAVAKVAGVVGAAVVAAGAALSRYTSEAAKTAEALRPLADLSGKAMESISALQIAFAQGGTSVQQFAKEFTALEASVQQAARTMAADVEASSQRIVKAHQGVAAAALSVEQAELGLQEQRLKSKGIDPAGDPRIKAAKERLALAAAEQRVADAQLAQQQAVHQARVAEANDLGRNIALYQQMGAGVKVAFDPLTTQATKTQALFATLAQAGENYTLVLADILQNASALERMQIGKALGLDPGTVETLSQGSAALRAQQQQVKALGIAISDVDRSNLKAFSNTWSELGATAGAALQKVGAALAPIGTALGQVLLAALQGVIQGVQTTAQEFRALGSVIDTVATAGAAAIDLMVRAVMKLVDTTIQAAARFRELRAPGAPLPEPGGVPMARGGMIGGRGTGTSDSNLAWLSRGEHIMPARAVAQPGVLAFLEALRRSGGNLSRVLDGMGRFALGGMVPRMPAMAFAGGGMVGGNLGTLHLALPSGGSVSVRATQSVVDQLHREAALAQVRSGGRKPSRYS